MQTLFHKIHTSTLYFMLHLTSVAYRKVLYKSRGFYDFLGEILQASIRDRLLYKTGISMYVNTKTRLMCDLLGPKLRLLFKGGFHSSAAFIQDFTVTKPHTPTFCRVNYS